MQRTKNTSSSLLVLSSKLLLFFIIPIFVYTNHKFYNIFSSHMTTRKMRKTLLSRNF
ncbi:hypothetical protein L873DRAFT_1924893 [Choiromyces venosus 120613-1]|uniref:Uncharacterized protein n=1 Tax=Choiromyces venosus 120613-1 TaxID=1336337 RepID=A0A3N4JDV0_9PEZI|nr:hypothetical protein L873DRAFT_1924893 [Choiromyces venosus 120613-1]